VFLRGFFILLELFTVRSSIFNTTLQASALNGIEDVMHNVLDESTKPAISRISLSVGIGYSFGKL